MLRAVTAVPLALAALTIAACGESGAGDNDPASIVPASAAIYVEATVRPEGDLRGDALAAAGKLLRTSDPAGRLRGLFDERLAERRPGASWRRDFAPWVGEKVGVWFTGLVDDEPSYAVIVHSRNKEAADAALARLGRADGTLPPAGPTRGSRMPSRRMASPSRRSRTSS